MNRREHPDLCWYGALQHIRGKIPACQAGVANQPYNVSEDHVAVYVVQAECAEPASDVRKGAAATYSSSIEESIPISVGTVPCNDSPPSFLRRGDGDILTMPWRRGCEKLRCTVTPQDRYCRSSAHHASCIALCCYQLASSALWWHCRG